MNIPVKILAVMLIFVSLQAQDNKSAYNAFAIEELRNQIDDILDDQNFKHAFWGVEVRSLKNDEIIYKRDSEKAFVPASTVKLFTSAACLLFLGGDFKYSTEVYSDTKPVSGEIDNLFIKASGDPTFSREAMAGEELFHPVSGFADSLKKYDVTEIEKNLFADNNIFDNKFYGDGWELSSLDSWYSPPVSALSLDENLVKITITPAKYNYPADIRTEIKHPGISIVNKVITISENSKKSSWVKISKESESIVTVYGEIRENEEPISDYFPVHDPVKFFLENFKAELEQNGINVNGYTTDINKQPGDYSYDDLVFLFSVKSENLNSIIREINKNSNNFLAEVVLKTLGNELYGSGTSREGVAAVNDVLKNMGINTANLELVDGSGLSRYNLLTPRQVVKLLAYMYKSSEFENFYNSLPIGGVDGTLSDRMKNTSAENNVRAKPGYLRGVRTLSGYIKTKDDEPLAFSIMLNNYYVASNLANYMFDLICSRLANFSRNIN